MDKPMMLLILRMIARLIKLLVRVVEGDDVTFADVIEATDRMDAADDSWGEAHRNRKEKS